MVKAQDNGTDRPPLDQRFSSVDGMPPTSMLHRRASFSRPMDCGKDRQSPVAGEQGLSTATAATGQGQATSPVAGLQGGDTHQALSSHSARTSNVTRWTVEQPQHLSIKASAGAQQRITDKTGKSIADTRTAGQDIQSVAQRGIGSKESRLATLGWPLDFNEVDHFASSNVDLIEQRSAPPSAAASGESSAGHPTHASSGGQKHVGGGSEVDYGSGSREEETVTFSEHRRHRFNGA